jgi:hypothetical protein
MSCRVQECLSESCQVVVFVGVNAGHWWMTLTELT